MDVSSHVEVGSFLIAGPYLVDPNFRRTVVLICEHNDEGSLGLIINRPLKAPLSAVFPNLFTSDHEAGNVYSGGPVEHGRLLALHRGQAIDTSTAEDIGDDEADDLDEARHEGVPLGDGLRLVSAVESTLNNVAMGLYDASEYRFFLGYAGWGKGQLEGELAEDSWIVRPSTAAHVFATHSKAVWSLALEELGGIYKFFAEMPMDPSMN